MNKIDFPRIGVDGLVRSQKKIEEEFSGLFL